MFSKAFNEIGETVSSSEIRTGSALGPAYAAALDAARSVSDEADSLMASLPPPSGIDHIALKTGETFTFGFVISTEANAFADKLDDRIYAAGMFTGLPIVLRGLFTELVANGSFLKGARLAAADAPKFESNGAPITEQYFKDLGEAKTWTLERQQAYRNAILRLDGELSEVRKGARNMLTFHALKYVWLHEIGHIAFGHCDHRKRHHAGPLFEHDVKSSPAAKMSDRDVLRMYKEAQADDFASYELQKEAVAALLIEVMDGDTTNDHHDYLIDHFVAATVAGYCLFMIRIMMTGTWTREKEGVPFVDLLGAGSYPPDQVRALAPLWGAGKVFADFRRANMGQEALITSAMQDFTKRALDSLDDLAVISDAFRLYRSFFSSTVFNATYDWAMENHFGDRVDRAAADLKPFLKRELLIQAAIDTDLPKKGG